MGLGCVPGDRVETLSSALCSFQEWATLWLGASVRITGLVFGINNKKNIAKSSVNHGDDFTKT
jgi:hypothetical protein